MVRWTPRRKPPPSSLCEVSHTRPVPGMIGLWSQRSPASVPDEVTNEATQSYFGSIGRRHHASWPVAGFTETSSSPGVRAVFCKLRRLGYVEGKDLLIERYSGEGRAAQYPDLAREVVVRNPDLIIAFSTNLTLDFKATTTTISIVGVFAAPIEAFPGAMMVAVDQSRRSGRKTSAASLRISRSAGRLFGVNELQSLLVFDIRNCYFLMVVFGYISIARDARS
jgi:hypothetical protein